MGINLQSLKRNVYEASLRSKLENNIDKVALSCWLFNDLLDLANKGKLTADTKTLALSFLESYEGKLRTAKEKYVSYSSIRKLLEKGGWNSILTMGAADIGKVAEYFQDIREKEDFSMFIFSPLQYKILKITYEQERRLRKVHEKIMVPIAKYLYEKYGTDPRGIEIADAELVPEIPGKEIRFFVDGVKSSDIVGAIISNKININEFLYKVSISDVYVDIISKI